MSHSEHALNANLRAEMARRAMNQAALAAQIGISQSALSRRLTGDSEWTVSELLRAAEVLGVPVTTFLTAQASA